MFFAMPSISNKTVPALILTPQCETFPLPLPILTSMGFAVIGIVGKTRIQSFPLRLSFRVMACRAASICRDDIVPDLIAFNPIEPKFSLFERKLALVNLPFCIFLYLVFLGCNHIDLLITIFT